jgi:hypothetical protein
MSHVDVRTLGVVRSMDLFMYVLYSNDERFLRDMISKVVDEVAAEYGCEELAELMAERFHTRPQLYRCLFFLLLDCHAKFRYWALEDRSLGLVPVCPHKAARFLGLLRAELAPRFLVNEAMHPDELERELKVEYLRA